MNDKIFFSISRPKISPKKFINFLYIVLFEKKKKKESQIVFENLERRTLLFLRNLLVLKIFGKWHFNSSYLLKYQQRTNEFDFIV